MTRLASFAAIGALLFSASAEANTQEGRFKHGVTDAQAIRAIQNTPKVDKLNGFFKLAAPFFAQRNTPHGVEVTDLLTGGLITRTRIEAHGGQVVYQHRGADGLVDLVHAIGTDVPNATRSSIRRGR
jgi:hypothetical protein